MIKFVIHLVITCIQVRDAEAVGKRMKTDIHNCVGFLQEPKKLKESIKTMFETHVHDDVVSLLACFFVLLCSSV